MAVRTIGVLFLAFLFGCGAADAQQATGNEILLLQKIRGDKQILIHAEMKVILKTLKKGIRRVAGTIRNFTDSSVVVELYHQKDGQPLLREVAIKDISSLSIKGRKHPIVKALGVLTTFTFGLFVVGSVIYVLEFYSINEALLFVVVMAGVVSVVGFAIGLALLKPKAYDIESDWRLRRASLLTWSDIPDK